MGAVLDYISVKCNEAGHTRLSSLWVGSKGIKLNDSIVWEPSQQYLRKPSAHIVVLGYRLWLGVLSVDNWQSVSLTMPTSLSSQNLQVLSNKFFMLKKKL